MTRTAASENACIDRLQNHALAERYLKSQERLATVRRTFADCVNITDQPLAIFCAGSLARMEIGAKSDLDVFVTADAVDESHKLRKRLFQLRLFSEMIAANDRLNFQSFSNDGEYLKLCFFGRYQVSHRFTYRRQRESLYDAHAIDIGESVRRERTRIPGSTFMMS